ncbi:putative uncharacterized protein DDB_G0282133 [Diaphorina citri]|uniref:Uncharacterized protein n=1 Tax=Diaphorina citri TaxID=121845 RepID=A0A3Q0J5V5_DIACI|nr:putative uncharacterized protein DDB_G0282133 [Diaphorina citri]
MKDDQSWKGLSEKLYCHSENASNIEPTSTQTQPIHTIDSSSSSSEEESEDDEDSRSSSSDSDIMIIDSDKEKQAKPNEKSKSIEILTLDSSEDEGKSHKQILTGTKTTLKKENTSNVLEDFIPFKRFKNEESDEDIPKPSNRRRNKRNLKISKNIFRPDVNQDVPQGIENVSRGIEQPGNDLQVSNDLVEANISQFVQGAVEQLSQAMSMNLQGLNQGINNRGRGGGHRGHYERNWGQSQSFTPQNQHFVPGPQTNTNFGTFFNENHSMGNLPQVNTFGSVTPFGTSLPPTNIMDGTQSSVLNPAFEQLSQLNQMLDGINSSIQRSVSGLYKLKRLQDPNYRPYYRRHPNQGGNFNNGPRFNNFNDNRNQFNRFNNPRSFNNFNGPNQRFPYQPMGNYQPRNMYQPDGHQMNQYNQMQPYGFNQEPSQPMIPHDVNYTGNLDPTEPNAFVNQESSNSQRPNVNHQNSNSNRSNVKKEAEDSSSEEDDESEEEEDSEEDEVKPNIAKVNNVLPTSTSVPSKAQSINPVVNIKKENEQPTAGTAGLNKPTHIRFNVQSSSSSEEETSDEETANKVVSNVVKDKEEVEKENEDESEEESSDEETNTKVNKNSNNVSKGEIVKNKDEVNKENEQESEEESSEEDSGKDSSSDDASDENMDTDNNNEPASNETMFAVSFKKRTHIRFNIEDSDDETADNADKVSKDNDKAQKVEGTHQKVQGTQLQGELLNGDINADKQGNTTDEELERENEKLIIFHSEIITPEQRSQFLNNFSNNPVDILNYIYSRILSNQRIKLIDRKIKRCFPAKTDTRRLLLQKVLKKERDSLKKRRYNVRKRLLRRALRKGNCKTYVGTVLKAPPIVSSDSDEDMKGEAEEKEDSSNTGDKSDKKQSNNSFDIRDKADNLLNTVSPEGETNEKVSDKIDPCDRKDNEEILSQTKPDRSSPSAIVTNNSECKDSEKLDELKTSNKENVPNDCDMKRSSPSNEDKLPMPSEINKTSTEVDAKIHETSTEADENVKASNDTEDSKTSTSTLDNASENSSDLVESSNENSQAPSSTLEITQSSKKTSNLSKDDLETSKNSASNLSNNAIVPNSSLENIQTDVSSKNKTDLDTPSEPIESDNSAHKLEENVRNDKEVVQSDHIVDAQSDKVVAQNDKVVAQNDKVDGQIDKVAPRPDESVENETNSMEVDETESTIHTESKDRSNSEQSKTGELSDDVNKSEETLEEKETQSLLNDEECSTYGEYF